MPDIELIIKIPEEIYRHYKKVCQEGKDSPPESHIELGTTLSNGQCEARLKAYMTDMLRVMHLENERKKQAMEQAIANGIPLSKDPYDARLKADIMATLSNIQLEIESKKRISKYLYYNNLKNAKSYNAGIDYCIDIIRDRINEIKSEE